MRERCHIDLLRSRLFVETLVAWVQQLRDIKHLKGRSPVYHQVSPADLGPLKTKVFLLEDPLFVDLVLDICVFLVEEVKRVIHPV